MKGKVYRSLHARRDLTGITRYYAHEASVKIARQFSAKADHTFHLLAEIPGMGTLYDPDQKHLSGLRSFPISGFEKYLVFYRPVSDGIEIIRVIHSARDISGMLEPTN